MAGGPEPARPANPQATLVASSFAASAATAYPRSSTTLNLGSLHIALAAGLLSVVAAIVAFSLVMAGDVLSQEQSDGMIWSWAAVALGFGALTWSTAAWRTRGGRPVTQQSDALIGGILAAVTLVLILVALVFGLKYDVLDQASSSDEGAFSSFREMMFSLISFSAALLTLAWLNLTRPIEGTRVRVVAGIVTAVALLLVVIGLILGHQSDEFTEWINPLVHGTSLILAGVALTTLAAGALVGERQ